MPVKSLSRLGISVLGLVLFASCTTRPDSAKIQATPDGPASAQAPVSKPDRNPLPALTRQFGAADPSVEVPEPPTTPPQPTSAPTPPKPPQASRTREITRLIQSGSLIESLPDRLVFSRSDRPAPSSNGLFADAITLNRLRGALKKISGLPESVSSSAKVQDGRATLTVSPSVSPELAARAVNSALDTEGIAIVQLTTAPVGSL